PTPAISTLSLHDALPIFHPRDLANVDGPGGVHGDAVGCQELLWLGPGQRVPQPRQQAVVERVDADPGAEVRDPLAHRQAWAQFPHVRPLPRRIPLIDEEAAGTEEVVPLGLESSLWIEHLDAVALPIGNVQIPFPIDADVVR